MDRNILSPVPTKDALVLVKAMVTHFRTFDRVYVPNKPFYRTSSGLEPTSTTRGAWSDLPSLETDEERSIRRTKSQIKKYILNNRFDLFATFTFSDDREDVEKSKSKMSNWLKNTQKRHGKFEYLIVPEFHEDGKAIHFHALIQGALGAIVQAINPRTGKPLLQSGRQIYSIPGYKSGFTNVIKVDSQDQSQAKLGSYVSKYITKGMPLFKNKNRYWVSKGLALPKTEDNPHWTPETATRMYGTEYGIVFEFDLKAGN